MTLVVNVNVMNLTGVALMEEIYRLPWNENRRRKTRENTGSLKVAARIEINHLHGTAYW